MSAGLSVRPGNLADVTTTGNPVPLPGADDVLRRLSDTAATLAGVEQLSLADAAATFDTVHVELQGALTDLDRA